MKPSILFFKGPPVINMPQVTTCALIKEDQTHTNISFGFARCSENEQFSLNKGRNIARNRANKGNFIVSIINEAYSPRSVAFMADYFAYNISLMSKFGKGLLYKEMPEIKEGKPRDPYKKTIDKLEKEIKRS